MKQMLSFPKCPSNAFMDTPTPPPVGGNNLKPFNWTVASAAAIDKVDAELSALNRFSLDVSIDAVVSGANIEVELIDGVGDRKSVV